MKVKFLICSAALGLALSVPTSVRADPFVFNADGGGPDPAVIANTFDYDPGNALAIGGNTAITDFLGFTAPPGTLTPFVTLFQARLGSILGVGVGPPNVTPPGMNISYEITIVSGFTEVVTAAIAVGVNGSLAAFVTVPGATNFFEIYFDAGLDSNQLAGTGFNNGTLIAAGTIVPGGSSSFSIPSTASPVSPLDQFPTATPIDDNYPGLLTRTGSGGSTISGTVTFLDPAFFPGSLVGGSITLFNTSQIDPFNQTDPSAMFVFAPGGGAPALAGAGIGIPSLGLVNGNISPFLLAPAIPVIPTGPDVQFQSDANQSFTLQQAIIPEPSTLLLSVIGFGSMAAVRFVRRRRQATV